jgi:hypothetical protein
MVSENEILQGYSLKLLVNGMPTDIERGSQYLCDTLDSLFGPRRVLWQGWFFVDTTILIFTIILPNAKELASFLCLEETLLEQRARPFIAEEVIPLSAPGTFRSLAEVIS